MHVLTEAEYEELVTELSEQVFDPLGDDETGERSDQILELVEEGDTDKAQRILRDASMYAAKFDNGLETHDRLNNRLEGPVAGSIIQHSDRAYRVKPSDVDATGAESAMTKMAIEALYLDVKGDASSRIRKIINDD